jgi:hypothetical protein
MNKVSHIVSGNLTDKEKSQMVSSLGKLKVFHEVVHEKDRNTGVDDIVEKYLTII